MLKQKGLYGAFGRKTAVAINIKYSQVLIVIRT